MTKRLFYARFILQDAAAAAAVAVLASWQSDYFNVIIADSAAF